MFGRPRRSPKAPLSARERLSRQAAPADDGGRAAYTVALAVLVFLLIGAVSARQVTAERQARTILEAGIATVSEIDLVLAEHGPELRQLASISATDPFAVPGYPLPVFVGKAEVLRASDAELRQLILDRSTGLVYAEGLTAFDRTGDQSLDTFSSQGLLELLVGQLSKDTYDAAQLASLILVALVGIVTIVLVLRGEGFGRLRALGGALVFGGLPGAGLAFGGRWVAQQLFGDDPFGNDLTAITDAVAGVPIRNYLAAVGLGAVVLALGIILPFVGRALDREPAPRAVKTPVRGRAPTAADPMANPAHDDLE
ncbi:MAG: hypothetical protein ACKVVT_19195 [Dehalococcoidia bacterium]